MISNLILTLEEKEILIDVLNGELIINAPNGVLTEDLISTIKAHKEEIVAYLSGITINNPVQYNIRPTSKKDHYPLSSSQRSLWILSQFTGSVAYNMPAVYLFEGNLNTTVFEHSFHILLERHEILRTVFKDDAKGEVRQFIKEADACGFKINYADLRQDREQEENIQQIVAQEAIQSFDLISGPLLRASLYQLEDNKWIFCCTMHHIINDAWSMKVLIKELLQVYNAGIRHEISPLTPLPIQYKDYAAWQREQLNNGAFDEHKSYWMKQFEGDLPSLKLPIDRPRNAIKTYNGAVSSLLLNQDAVGKLQQLCHDQAGTMFMGLMAILNTLLFRYTAQEDIIVGRVVAGREDIVLEDQIGFYVNTLALRTKFKGTDHFKDLLARIKQVVLEANEHKIYPFDEVVGALETQWDQNRNPLFDVMIEMKGNDIIDTATFGNLKDIKVSNYEASVNVTSKFDLTFFFTALPDGLKLDLEYNSDLFDRETMARMAVNFNTLLSAIVTNPLLPINKLNYIAEDEQYHLLEIFNPVPTDNNPVKSILELFEVQVKKNPENTALTFEGESLSYAALNKRSDDLANYLKTNSGIAANDLVGVMLDRSEKMIVSILGILKSGAAYVPIDPEYPLARKKYILQDTGLRVLVTTSDYIFDLPAYDYEGEVFAIDIQLDIIKDFPVAVKVPAEPGDLAYVIYTSGSTGNPKGCAITYNNLSNYVQGANGYYFDAIDDPSFGLYTSLSFDLTVTSIFCTLSQGGRLHIYSHYQDITAVLKDQFSDNNTINSIKLTPSHILLLKDLDIHSSTLLCAIVGGEAIRNEHLAILKSINPDIKIYNEYGPTEATVGCVVAQLEPDNRILIGKPAFNARIYILDNNLTIVPVGVHGELCIAGPGLAKEYLNQPDLTAEKFTFSPYHPGERIYKTGDIGCWLPDGNIEFTGRKDDQVKIRGYRVEPREVEQILLTHAGVKQAVVLAKDDWQGNKNLVAYYIPKKEFGYKTDKVLENSKKGLPAGAKLYGLSTDLDLYAYNKTELQFLYEEVFVEQCYLKYGITIPDNACIVDIGANIGMFSVFAGMQAKNVKVFSFEPLPPTFELLRLNTSLYPYDYNVFNIGISDREETAVFSYFPNATVLSSRYSEGEDITETVKQTILNKEGDSQTDLTDGEVNELLKDRLITEKFECKLKSLSQIIAEHGITQIDYLKIDVEKSELDVLNGILAEDWKKIKQIVLEIHDIDGRLELIKTLLTSHGFNIQINQNAYLNGTALYDVYAIAGNMVRYFNSEPKEVHQSVKQWSVEGNLRNEIRTFMKDSLPGYMVPAYFVELSEFPFTINGKLDKRQLPNPEELGLQSQTEYIAPRNETEKKLVKIWEEVLGRENIGVKDNFFDLGGHSLKATRLSSQLHKVFNVKLDLKELFDVTVLEEQAVLIQQSKKTSFEALKPVALQAHYALSSAQRRLWVLNQFSEGSAAYHLPAVYVFEGFLDQKALQYAFEQLISRHEILRTIFRADEYGEVHQFVLPPESSGFEIKLHNLSHSESPAEELPIIIQSASNTPFDLSVGPLLRAGLYRLANNKWVFTYVMHHIISDGWSMGVLIRELLTYYSAYIKGMPLTLPPLRIQYKDYAAWQQEQLSGESLDYHKNYWLQQFEGDLPVSQFPTDKPRPAVKTYNGGFVHQKIGSSVLKGLQDLLQEEGSTLFMGLLATVNVLLHRYSNQEDMIIGSPIAGREHADLENQLGFYVNTLALRSRFKGTESYRCVLAGVKSLTLGAYEHQAYPFDELVDELSLQRDMSRNALFDIMVVLQDTDVPVQGDDLISGLKVSAYEGGSHEISKFDLTFYFAATDIGLGLTLEYNSDLYEIATAERIGRHLVQLLESIIASPDLPVEDLIFLNKSEEEELLLEFNMTAADYPRDKTLIGLFELQVMKDAQRTALVFEDREMSYGELNSLSNQLASYLRNRYSIEPDDLIGIHLERSEWMVISILAALKSGGAYVPIDPDYPEERVAYMRSDSGCKVLINISELELFKSQAAEYSSENQAVATGSEHLAYVIYTSGSTGKPKGCMLTNKGIVNRLEWMWKQYGFGEEDIILQKTTFTFDVSVWELFLPLCWGTKMVLCKKEDIGSPERILSLIEQQQVSCLHFVPGMLNAFISALFHQQDIVRRLKSLKNVITSGEALPIETIRSWYSVMTVPIHNLYGPTEASIDVTAFTTSDQDTQSLIGQPIWNTQIYITGENYQLQPIGVPGEICISGDGLARGYLNQPILTAEKFVSHPFSIGKKMYRTGDLGKWLPDGNIVYLGRKDNQVKIRGYRIEPGEIESALQSYAGINAAVVLTKHNGQGEQELVAYFIADTNVNALQLRTHLSSILPFYMLPIHYIQLEEFPLTANGKIDRKKLPAPAEELEISSGITYVAPRNEMETKMVQVWEEILKREKIGVKDDFFALGGHSLKAAQLLARITNVFLVRINIQSLFKEPTVEAICEQIVFLLDQQKQEENKEQMLQIEI
ncbi:amino acid adenylation domain-containing protein [Pedobacter sp. KACC 23697]|uniref:Amino acid adenylation domain-containing protein n=1 Tax=Pedobacter sp. KACC 23697 TaxID=3149230 RepID=A0AAU7K8Y5_9SPHI